MRVAQRAHRQRKETKLADLEARVAQSQDTLSAVRESVLAVSVTLGNVAITAGNSAVRRVVEEAIDSLRQAAQVRNYDSATRAISQREANTRHLHGSGAESITPSYVALDHYSPPTEYSGTDGLFGFQLYEYTMILAHRIISGDDPLSVRLTYRMFGTNLAARRERNMDASITGLRKRIRQWYLPGIERQHEAVMLGGSWHGEAERPKWPGKFVPLEAALCGEG